MKKFHLITFLIFIGISTSVAQVGINSDSSVPDQAAILDIKSTDRGFLPPRMTFEQRNAISNPVEGLMVYCTNCRPDGSGALSVYQSGKWTTPQYTCLSPLTPTPGTHLSTPDQITWNWNTVPIALGYKWSTVNNYATATDLASETTKTETGLTCQSTYTRFVWAYNGCGPSSPLTLTQTTQQIPLTGVPGEGTHETTSAQITWNWTEVTGASGYRWNTTNNFATSADQGSSLIKTESGLACNMLYTRFVWAYDSCGNSNATSLSASTTVTPAIPTAGILAPAFFQITWNWNPVPGATGYKWNTTDNYTSATDMGTALTKTETGLTMGTTFTRYVWAYNACSGISASVAITSQTLTCDPVTVNHIAGMVAPVSKSVTYGTVFAMPGEPAKCWITQNLGANIQADSMNAKAESKAGWYWQFNRKQGYRHDGIARTPNTPWITIINENSDWLPANDPCNLELGTPWRVPVYTEWYNVNSAGGWTSWYSAWNSQLKVHAAGYLARTDGSVTNRGVLGFYRCSSQYNSTVGWNLYFGNSWSYMATNNTKAAAITVRCIKGY